MKFRKKPVVIEAVQFTEAVRDAALFDGQPLPDGVRCGASTLHPPTRKPCAALALLAMWLTLKTGEAKPQTTSFHCLLD